MSDEASRVSTLCEVQGTFVDPAQMQDAAAKLAVSGFDRADLTLPSRGHALTEAESATAAKPVDTEADAMQVRTLGGSTAGAAAAIAAAGITVATGGAAAPAVAAAVVAGGLVGGGTAAVIGSGAAVEQHDRDAQAAGGGLTLSVRTRDDAAIAHATAILRSHGAIHIETFRQETV
jgi:hypothetical protein